MTKKVLAIFTFISFVSFLLVFVICNDSKSVKDSKFGMGPPIIAVQKAQEDILKDSAENQKIKNAPLLEENKNSIGPGKTEVASKQVRSGNKSQMAILSERQSRGQQSLSGYNIVDNLPEGYVKDASVDYTSYLQEALDLHDNLVFPGFPILVNDNGLKIGSNKTLTFLNGSELRLKPSSKKSYEVISIRDASNVKISNVSIKGDRYSHLGTEGEWGMGIAIRGSKDIKILNARIVDCWGDGIYIGQTQTNKTSHNIRISDAYLAKNRRDGISIISVDELLLTNVYAGKQDGTLPMCGINFEPNNSDCEIKNVIVSNPRTELNGGSGIQIGIKNLLGGRDKKIDIQVLGHSDVGSGKFAVKISCNRKEGNTQGSVSGLVDFQSPSWYNTFSGKPLLFVTDQQNLKVKISSANIKNARGYTYSAEEIKNLLTRSAGANLEYFSKN